MTVVCTHTAIAAKRSARLMGKMRPGIKLGYNRGVARKTIVYYAYKLMVKICSSTLPGRAWLPL